MAQLTALRVEFKAGDLFAAEFAGGDVVCQSILLSEHDILICQSSDGSPAKTRRINPAHPFWSVVGEVEGGLPPELAIFANMQIHLEEAVAHAKSGLGSLLPPGWQQRR